MKLPSVLFVCIHNSARSQMAEAWLKHLCGDSFTVESAGLEPGKLNPFVVKAMAEVGIDISGNSTKSVFDFVRAGKTFNYIIAVCDREAAERCPIFPGVAQRLEWNFPDPSAVTGSDEEKLQFAREVRDTIRDRISLWCSELCPR
jgi:arsenate reductase